MVRVRHEETQRFYQKPYVKKTLISGVALVSIAAVGCAAYYNRGRLSTNPLANRMGWVNWNNAKTALITAGKTTAVAIGGLGGLTASFFSLGYIEDNTKIDIKIPTWLSLLAGGTVAGSMLVGYPLGTTMKTASFVSAAIVGGGIGFLVGSYLADEDEDSVVPPITGAVVGAGAGLGLVGAAHYVGLISAATPLVKSIPSQVVELIKNHPSQTCKVAFLAFLCFKVLPKLGGPALRFLREDVLKGKEWGQYEYKRHMHAKKTRMLGVALFGLGCFALFSKSLPVDADFLRKAVAVGLGVSIPVLLCNLTRSSGGNSASEENLAHEVENLKAKLTTMSNRHNDFNQELYSQQGEIGRERNKQNKLKGKVTELTEELDSLLEKFNKRLSDLESASQAKEMLNTQLEEEEESDLGRISRTLSVASSHASDD